MSCKYNIFASFNYTFLFRKQIVRLRLVLSKKIKRIPVKCRICLAINSSSFDVKLTCIVSASHIYMNAMTIKISFVSSLYSLMEYLMLAINDVCWTGGMSEMEILLSTIMLSKQSPVSMIHESIILL